MTADDLRTQVRTFRYSDAVYVIVDSLPQPYQDDFWMFLLALRGPLVTGGIGTPIQATLSAGFVPVMAS